MCLYLGPYHMDANTDISNICIIGLLSKGLLRSHRDTFTMFPLLLFITHSRKLGWGSISSRNPDKHRL